MANNSKLTPKEFRAASEAAAQCRRPATAFGLLIALLCIRNRISMPYLSTLIGVSITSISNAAKDLEGLGALTRQWQESKSHYPNKHHPQHGRIRECILSDVWAAANLAYSVDEERTIVEESTC
jgi:hypothetical protein